MKRLLLCICIGLFSTTASADFAVNQWLQMQSDRGAQIEFIRVTSEKALVVTEETDAEVASILEEAEALETITSDGESLEDDS